MTTDRPALRRCVAGDLDAFAADAWGRQAVLSRADDLAKDGDERAPTARAFSDLFSLDAVDELLAHRGLTIREVALRVGYRQPAQFAKAFRRHHGVAPSEFRARRAHRAATATLAA